jgi:Tfp pilus assembly major pilin PilA
MKRLSALKSANTSKSLPLLSQITAAASAKQSSLNKHQQSTALAKSSPGLLQEAELRQLELSARPKEQQNDLWYKACKKIAQLTKVIYFLNTQTEDTELQLQEERHQHRDELIKVCNYRYYKQK